jgi:hypothetical protein
MFTNNQLGDEHRILNIINPLETWLSVCDRLRPVTLIRATQINCMLNPMHIYPGLVGVVVQDELRICDCTVEDSPSLVDEGISVSTSCHIDLYPCSSAENEARLDGPRHMWATTKIEPDVKHLPGRRYGRYIEDRTASAHLHVCFGRYHIPCVRKHGLQIQRKVHVNPHRPSSWLWHHAAKTATIENVDATKVNACKLQFCAYN